MIRSSHIRCASIAAIVLLAATRAGAQVEIKVNDDVNFKLGVLGQFQADTIGDPTTDTNTENLFVRRLRLMFGGQVAKGVTFFVETDSPNLGKTLATGKNIPSTMIVQDAYAEFAAGKAFAIDAGLMFIPFSRNSLQSAATLLPIDYGAYTFSQSAVTQSSTGRDTGFQAKGYLLADRLEYRIGAFQGARDAASDNGFRYAGRLQYDFLDTETGFFYTGTYLGKKKVLAVGAAFDAQQHYHAYDADAFLDYPAGPGAFTGQIDYNRFNGDLTFSTLPQQNDYPGRSRLPYLGAEAHAGATVVEPRRRRSHEGRRETLVGRRELLVGRPERQRQGGVLANHAGRRDEPERVHAAAAVVLLLESSCRGSSMQRKRRSFLAVTFLVLIGLPGAILQARAQAGKASYPAMAPLDQYLIPDRNAEIALARSAAPPSISDGAEVMVLEPKGYATAVKGTNGFLCLVERSWGSPTNDPGFWNPKMRAPHCFNAAAARTFAPIFLMKTKLVLAGKSRAEILQATASALDRKELPALEPGAMCYMTSKQQYLERRRQELAPPSDVFRSGRRREKLGSQSAGLAGDRGRRS